MLSVNRILSRPRQQVLAYLIEHIQPIVADHPDVSELIVDHRINPEIREYPDESVNYVTLCVIGHLIQISVVNRIVLNQYWRTQQNALTTLNSLLL